MILDILRHTPTWVFGIFVLLVALGIRQGRDRRVSLTALIAVPAAMALWSVSLMFQSLGPVALAAWAAAWTACIALGLRRAPRSDVQYSPATRSFSVPGSWLPLTLMMTLFFSRYAVGVSLAMKPSLHEATGFVVAVGALSGLVAGLFAARALRIGRTARSGSPGDHRVVSAA